MTYHTIREIVRSAEEQFDDGDAVRYKIGKNTIVSRSYHDLRRDSERFSLALETLGLRGTHVALTGMTSWEWIVSCLGIVNGGCVAVPLDVSLPAEELCELVNRADVTALCMDGTRPDVAGMVLDRCPNLRYLIRMDQAENEDGVLSFSKLITAHPGHCDYTPKPDDMCMIMFTSGTTGKSKGVMLTHRNLANNATCMDLRIKPRNVLLTVLPIHHAYCLSMDILKGISLGSIICINDSLIRMAKNIRLFQPDMILMVPLMIESMAKKLRDAQDLPPETVRRNVFGENLHTICSGGAYLNPDYIDLFAKYGITIQQGYGMTECSPVISTNPGWAIRKDSVGLLMPNCEAKTVDGELWVRGSSVMQGYYRMPQETADTLEDGWLKTGDLGYVDEDRYVHLTGRKKNLIITKNGENVSPEEIENKIGEAPLVQEILVREADGVIEAEIYPDFEYAAKMALSDPAEELQKIIDAFNKGVPMYKRIGHLKMRKTEFEKTPSKKIRRSYRNH